MEGGVGPKVLADFITIHVRHHYVKQNQVGNRRAMPAESLRDRRCLCDVISPTAQHDAVHRPGRRHRPQ